MLRKFILFILCFKVYSVDLIVNKKVKIGGYHNLIGEIFVPEVNNMVYAKYLGSDLRNGLDLRKIRYINIMRPIDTLPRGLYQWSNDIKSLNNCKTEYIRPFLYDVRYIEKNGVFVSVLDNSIRWNEKKSSIHPWENIKKNYSSRLAPEFKEFFYEIFGEYEANFAELDIHQRKNFLKKYEDECGVYKSYTIDELRYLTKDIHHPFSGKGFFKVIYNKPIQKLLAEEEFNGSAIQSASTVNSLEGGMGCKSRLLINMQQHAVQGETVAFCAFYGSVYRKYIIDAELKARGFSGINLLEAVPGFKVRDGSIIKIPSRISAEDLGKIKIGYQYNTAVAFESRDSNNFLQRRVEPARIDQAISFALDLSPLHGLSYDISDRNVRNIAKELLYATYEGAIRAAFLHGRQKIILTTVGLGAFKNKKEWCVEAILRMINFIREKKMQVYLALFAPNKHLNKDFDYESISGV